MIAPVVAGSAAGVVALVLHFRDGVRTLACLDSLLAEGIHRALVVDNSEDGGQSLRWLRSTIASRGGGFDLQVSEPGCNLGFAKGVNLGLQAILDHYGAVHVLLLNNDAVLLSGAVERLLSALRKSTGLALAAPTLVTPVGDFSSLAYYQPYLALITRRPWPGSLAHLGGCCMLIPPSLAASALLDEDFFFYGEDFELGARCVRAGIALIGADDARVGHAMSAGSRNGSLFYEYHMARAHCVVVGKLASNRFDRFQMWLGRSIALPVRAMMRGIRHRSLRPLVGLVLAATDVWHGRFRNLTPVADGTEIARDKQPS